MKTKFKRIANMSTGERFLYPGHMSLMIKTDQKNKTAFQTLYLAVSENGLVEWIKDDEKTYLCVNVKEEFVKLSLIIKDKIIKS